MDFQKLLDVQDKKYDRSPAPESILCFDPGHTTGWAVFKDSTLANSGQINTRDDTKAPHLINELFQQHQPDIVICEDYRVYGWRQEHHVGSDMLTTRIIGMVETCAAFMYVPIIKYMAVEAKRFCTDKKLKEWGFYVKSQKHARDAIRHGCYYLVFRHISDPNHGKSKSRTTVG